MKNNRHLQKGFTLVELLIVVAIIAILVAIAVPVLNGQLEKAREATDLANIRAAYAQLSIDMIEDDTVTEVPPVQLKQKQDGWKIEGNEVLSAIGTVDPDHPTPTSGGKCTVSWSDTYNTVLFTFDGEGGGGSTPVGYNFGDTRKSRMTTMARAFADILSDADTYLVNSYISGSKFGPVEDKGESFYYREIWLNPSGVDGLNTTKYYQDGAGVHHSYNIAEMLAEKGVDYSDFSDPDFVGSSPVLYFDTETNEPLAVTYFKEGNSGPYRYVYLKDGKTYEATNSQSRQYIVYHRDYAENNLTEITGE